MEHCSCRSLCIIKLLSDDMQVDLESKICKSKLSARSSTGTGHLIRHQKSYKEKTDHATRV